MWLAINGEKMEGMIIIKSLLKLKSSCKLKSLRKIKSLRKLKAFVSHMLKS